MFDPDQTSDGDLVAAKLQIARDLPNHSREILALPDEFPGFAAAALRLILEEAKEASSHRRAPEQLSSFQFRLGAAQLGSIEPS